jgi:gluconolactonase
MHVADSLTHRLETLVDVDAHEGPVYVEAEHALYFTTLPKPGPLVSIKRLDLDTLEVTVVREDANGANGMTLGLDGRLLVCEQGTPGRRARISAVDPATGATETVVEDLGGRPLNSPNDIVVARDGSIWFTDPSYGFLQGFKPRPALSDNVYRFDGRRLEVVEESFDKPNGLAFSPDESVLYVGDSGSNHEPGTFEPSRPHHIRAFDVVGGARLENGRPLATIEPGFPDGIKVDSEGRIYASSFSGVQVFSPLGDLLGEIALPGAVNFAFGAAHRNVLYVTADTAIWAAVLNAAGPQPI